MGLALLAGGTINVSRFVQIDPTNTTTGGFHAIQCNGTTYAKPSGISQEASNVTPFNANSVFGALAAANYAQIAAASGEPVWIHGPGEECPLYAGAAVSVGQDLVSDSAGMGVVATATSEANWQYIGARALQGAAAQYEKIRVLVLAYGTASGS